ncbi:MAG: MFS transporter [Promethearchaeota archaeon]|nr:MAG: MFS transporter [Candidatus Lokiarchaeota archaeon]
MSEEKKSLKTKLFYALNGFPDLMTYQAFSFLVFTYYFAVVGIPIFQMWIAFIIWGLWNAINDPMLGALSDRKKYGKLGKRKFFITIALIPLALMMILLFTVPLDIKFFYFLAIIMLFEFTYTLFDVNVKALFPEQWENEEERASANLILRPITLMAILIAMVLPTIIISPLVPLPTSSEAEIARIPTMYITAGIIFAVIAIITGALFIMYGIKEPEELPEQFESRPSFFGSLKLSLKNKSFVKLVLCNTMTWYVLTMLTTIFSLYAIFVLGVGKGSIFIGLSLMSTFIVAALAMPFYVKLGRKIGMRNAFIASLIIWIITLVPFAFFGEGDILIGVIATAIVGIGMSGTLFFFDILMGDVVDEDYLKHGVKRSASFYGANAFIHRFSIILVITTIALVFSGTGWAGYNPNPGVDVIIGLKLLMVLFPIIALIIATLFLKSYDLHGDKLVRIRDNLKQKTSLK